MKYSCISFNEAKISDPFTDLRPGDGVGGSWGMPSAEFVGTDLALRACALRRDASKEEDGEELLLGVLIAFGIVALLLTRLAGSYIPLSFCTSPATRISTLELACSDSFKDSPVEGPPELWKTQSPSLNGS